MQAISTLSALMIVLIVSLVVLAAAALGSLFIWMIITAWRHIIAPGQEDARLDDLEERMDALEESSTQK